MESEMYRLIEAVEGGTISDNPMDKSEFDILGILESEDAESAYYGSLDAAKALHEALLGEAHWSVAEDDDYGFCGRVYLGGWFHEHSTVAARAWLLAILKAYRAQQQE